MLMGTALRAVHVAVTAAAIRHPAPSRGSGGPPAPELTNTSWLNADRPLRLAELRGRVVLLNFWVFTCGNCTRTVPSLVAYDRRYRARSEEHTSELQSRLHLVCRLLLEKKK